MKEGRYYPGIGQAIRLMLLFYLLTLLFQIPLTALEKFLSLSPDWSPVATTVISLIVYALIFKRGLLINRASFGEVFSFAPIRTRLLYPMTLTLFGAIVLLSELDNLFRLLLPAPPSVTALFAQFWEHWALIAYIVVIAPLAEELLFRGLILRGFLSRYSVKKAILASAVLFGVFHLIPWQIPGAVVLGALFAWWFLETGSLIPCIYGHVLVNGTPKTLTALFQIEIPGLTSDPSVVEFQPLWLDLAGLLLAGTGLWLLRQSFRESAAAAPPDSPLPPPAG